MSSFVVSTTTQQELVPFYGRNTAITQDHPLFQKALRSLVELRTSLNKITVSNKGENQWKHLSNSLDEFTTVFVNPQCPPKRYQVDVLLEAVIPYLQEIQSRIHTDVTRFHQLQQILSILTNSNSHLSVPTEHTSYDTLLRIDNVIVDIDRQGGLNIWKSSLSTRLSSAVKKQWDPIVRDHQKALRDAATKLIVLGLIEAFGRPLIFLYPLYLSSMEVLKMAHEFNTKKTLTPSSILQIIKMVVMLWCVMNLSSILAAYTGFGYLCLALGLGAFTISSNDATTKQAVPMLAPHMAALSMLLDKACHMERTVLSSINTTFSSSSFMQGEMYPRRGDVVSSDRDHHRQDSRVEELPDDDDEHDDHQTSSSRRHHQSSSPSAHTNRPSRSSGSSSSSYGRGEASSGGSATRESRGNEKNSGENDHEDGWEEDRASGNQGRGRPMDHDEDEDGDLQHSGDGDQGGGVRRRNNRK